MAIKFDYWYWSTKRPGHQMHAQCNIERTSNAAKLSFSLTNNQKLVLAELIEGKTQVQFDGYISRKYTGLYGYPKHEVVAARFVIDGEQIALRKTGEEY